MTAEEMAETIRDYLDGEYDDVAEAYLKVRVDGATVEITADVEPEAWKFRMVVEEVEA